MLLSSVFPFAMLLASAAADLHASCVCNLNHEFNSFITYAACDAYSKSNYPWGKAAWDNDTGRCKAVPGASLGGNEWEQACKTASKTYTYQCTIGLCHADPNQVRGDC